MAKGSTENNIMASDTVHTKFYHNADKLLGLTKEKIGKNPAYFVTDGLPAYMKSSKKVFGKKNHHSKRFTLQEKFGLI